MDQVDGYVRERIMLVIQLEVSCISFLQVMGTTKRTDVKLILPRSAEMITSLSPVRLAGYQESLRSLSILGTVPLVALFTYPYRRIWAVQELLTET